MTNLIKNEQISAGKYPFKYILSPYAGAKWLLVVFSAFAPDKSPDQHIYNFMNVLESVPAHKLYIQDSQGQRGVYYLCRQLDFGVSEEVCDLIQSIQKKLDCDADHTVSIGSSKGGSAALYFALRLKFAHALSMVPQFRIGTYLDCPGKQSVLEEMVGTQDIPAGVKILDGIIEAELKKNTTTKVHVLTSHFDEQYETQIAPLEQAVVTYQRQTQCKLRFDDRIKGHNGAANHNADFVHEKLMGILFDCNLSVKDGFLTLTRTQPDTSEFNIIYLVEKWDGTSQEYHLKDQQYTFPIQELSYTELTVWKDQKVIYQRYFCDWLSNLLHVECSKSKDGIQLAFVQDSSCTLPMQYSFYVRNRNNEVLERVSPSAKAEYCISNSDLDGGSIQYFFKYKNYVYWDTISVASIPLGEQSTEEKASAASDMKPSIFGQTAYTITCRNHCLSFQIAAPKDENTLYAFYVMRDSKRIYTQGYSSTPAITFKLTDPGKYSVVYFLKQKEEVVYHTSDSVPYFPRKACIYGPKMLNELCDSYAIVHTATHSEAEFMLLDPLSLAYEWVERIFTGDKPDLSAVAEMCDELQVFLSENQLCSTYIIQWNLWESGEQGKRLLWVLEELYHVCRRPGWNTVEFLPAIKTAALYDETQNLSPPFLYQAHQRDLEDVLEQLVQQLELSGLDDAHIEINQVGNCMTASMTSSALKEGDQFAFYLFLNQEVIDRTAWGKQPSMQWELTKDGIYSVQGFLKRSGKIITRKGLGPAIYGKESREQFERFLEDSTTGEDCTLSQVLPFVPNTSPFCDILLLSANNGVLKQMPVGFPVPYLSQLKIGSWNTELYTQGQVITCANGDKALFSGRICHNKKLYFGLEIADYLSSGQDLADQKGHYSYLTWNEKSLTLGSDFFGFNQWFYYQSDSLLVASNNYHLLLLALKAQGITLELDISKAIITLSSTSIQMLSQNFSRKMDLKGAYQLTADQRMCLGESGWQTIDSVCGRMMKENTVYHEAEYRQQLLSAREELMENAATVLNDPRFEKIDLDLTGGLDSRLVYSIMTNLNFDRDRVKVNTYPTPGSHDLDVATQINALYSFQYNDFPQTLELLSYRDGDIRCRSMSLGLYYSYGTLNTVSNESNYCHLIGACGEVMARPYVGRKYLHTHVARQRDCAQLVQCLYEDYAHEFVIGSEELRSIFLKYVGDELSLIPGKTPLQRLENHYYSFRHASHFDLGERIANHLRIKLLQSTQMMHILQTCYGVHQSIRLQLDMLYMLNPAVASIPFESDKDNEDRDKLRQDLTLERMCWRNMTLRPDNKAEMAAWEQAELRRKQGTTYIKSPFQQNQDISSQLYLGLLRNFRTLMNVCPELRDKVGIALYQNFRRISGKTRNINYWYNKVTSLMNQIGIFHALSNEDSDPYVWQPPSFYSKKREPLLRVPSENCTQKSAVFSKTPSISIYGSCVSRDVFALAQDQRFELKAYVARQSMLSAVSPKIPKDALSLHNPSSFRQRAVEYDLQKTAFQVLRENKSDFLLIDLIDERFPLLPLFGSYVTASNEFYESVPEQYRSVASVQKCLKNGKLYLGNICAEAGVQEFCLRLSEIYNPEQIIIHYATFTDQYLSKSGKQTSFAKHYLSANHRINSILDVMYNRLACYLPGAHIIRETDGVLADENHKWGLAPMHYEVDYYRRVLARLYEIADLAENKG